MDKGRESVVKITLAAVLIYSIAHYYFCYRSLVRAEGELEAVSAEYCELSEENRRLTEKLENGYSERELEKLARERFAFIKDGEITFYFDKDRED